ncbi:MAG: TldD/PmbA family protein [Gemmatimonadota bacterium]
MIAPLLERAARRAHAADAVVKTDETVTLTFESGRLKRTSFAQERGTNLRVVVDGRMGFAGSTAADPDALLESAFASARLGEEVDLPMPRPSALPAVVTHSSRAASASVEQLADLGRVVVDRLSQDGYQITVTVERSVGSVRAANSAGVDASYDVSSVGVMVEVVRIKGDDVLIVGDFLAGTDLPSFATLEGLVSGVRRRLDWASRSADPVAGSLPICFTPSGSSALLLPLHLACLGKSALQGISPLADKLGTTWLDTSFSLSDEPLLDGRSGSRPVDDEGIPSVPLRLIERGVPRALIYDLETAGRAGCRPTGHGRRSTFGKPQAAYSNLVVAPGEHDLNGLLGLIDDGLLVDELLGVGQGNVIGGAFSHPVALAYRVVKGEVVGRVTDVAVAGNSYELLRRIAGIGSEQHWRGSAAIPEIVVADVAVAKR